MGRWTNGGEYKQVECAGNVLLLRFDVVFTAIYFQEKKKRKILNKINLLAIFTLIANTFKFSVGRLDLGIQIVYLKEEILHVIFF